MAAVADSSAPVRAPLMDALSPDPAVGLAQLARRWASPILASLADAFGDGGRDLNVDYLNAVALATAVEHRAPTRLALKRIAHPRHGLPWDEDEDQRLLAAFQQGATIEVLSEQHQRNSNAIKARLMKHGAIETTVRDVRPHGAVSCEVISTRTVASRTQRGRRSRTIALPVSVASVVGQAGNRLSATARKSATAGESW